MIYSDIILIHSYSVQYNNKLIFDSLKQHYVHQPPDYSVIYLKVFDFFQHELLFDYVQIVTVMLTKRFDLAIT